jgi:hypothetical protein
MDADHLGVATLGRRSRGRDEGAAGLLRCGRPSSGAGAKLLPGIGPHLGAPDQHRSLGTPEVGAVAARGVPAPAMVALALSPGGCREVGIRKMRTLPQRGSCRCGLPKNRGAPASGSVRVHGRSRVKGPWNADRSLIFSPDEFSGRSWHSTTELLPRSFVFRYFTVR